MIRKTISAFLFVFVLSLQGFSQGLTPGDNAPDFSLKNCKTDKKISLADYSKEKGAIVIFTCNHCPYSVKYEDRIIALHNAFAAKGFPVIAINPNDPVIAPDDSYENMKKRAKQKKFPFVYLYDETQEVAKAYGATRTPHVFLLSNQSGKFRVEYIGAIDDNASEPAQVSEKFVEKAIAELLSGQAVSTPEAKAVGCTIKWKKS